MNVLLAGHISYNLMAPFAANLKHTFPHYKIGVLGLNRPGVTLTEEERARFEVIHETPTWALRELYAVLPSLTFIRYWWQHRQTQTTKSSLKQSVINAARGLLRDRYYQALFASYEMIQFNYIDTPSTRYTKFLLPTHKVMLTFWGSDLLQTAGVKVYQEQLELLQKASMITIQSLDLREILLAKYGRALKDKVRISFYGIADERFNNLDQGRKTPALQEKMRQTWQIPTHKLVLVIGYCGAKGMQHLEVLEALETLPKAIQEKLHLVFPMTYGNNDVAYLEQVKAGLHQTPYSYTQLTEYLSDEDIATFYNLADIFVNVRETDACNASMLELMYLDKAVIVGSWLPYGLVRRAGARYLEIDQVEELPTTLTNLIAQADWQQQFKNRAIIRTTFGHGVAIPRWENLFRELEQL